VNVLAVETSCDETSVALVRDGRQILANVVSSQIDLHRPYGGVVPELAARHHLELIDAIATEAIQQSGISWRDVDAVAATYGPGLAISLLVGLNAAKGIALALGKPFLGINHLEAHLYSPLLEHEPAFPMISLIVSGGHTILAECEGIGRHRMLGQTVDDAAGEAFDKVAKLLGLGYPGGPAIEQQARQGNPAAIDFPRSMLHDPGDAFSFSGLKTAVLYYLRNHPRFVLPDVCASFQEAVVDVLVGKTVRAAKEYRARSVSAAGGVSINGRFRERLRAAWSGPLFLAPPALCTDNAAMIAALAYHKLLTGQRSEFTLEVAPSVGLGMDTLP
jgi:N6-L-threonylcarbamoyladenine synthase